MCEMRARARSYPLVILRRAARYNEPERGAVMWEHRHRNHSLRADGALAIVCPGANDTEWSGIGVFGKEPEETARIMDGDPAVQADVLSYVVHPVRGFPGDSLPQCQGGRR